MIEKKKGEGEREREDLRCHKNQVLHPILSVNSVQQCVIFALSAGMRLNRFHPPKWTFLEMGTSVNLMSALLQWNRKADELGCEQMEEGESIVCPSAFISRWDQIHLSCGICNEPLVPVNDVPARASRWFVQQSRVQEGWTEKQNAKVVISKRDFTVDLNALTFIYLSGFVSWILVQGQYLSFRTLVCKWCRPGHLSSDNEAIVPFSSHPWLTVAAPVPYHHVTKEIKLQI